MSGSAYDAKQLRVISDAVATALLELEGSRTEAFSKTEKSKASKWISDNVLAAYDSGERDPAALKQAGLVGIAARIGWTVIGREP